MGSSRGVLSFHGRVYQCWFHRCSVLKTTNLLINSRSTSSKSPVIKFLVIIIVFIFIILFAIDFRFLFRLDRMNGLI